MALWAGIATPQQAQEIVARQYLDTTLFCCPAGVRSLSPLEKMYNTKASGNPRRGRGRYGYVSTISSSVGSSGTDTPPWHVSWHGRQSYSSAGILSASEPLHEYYLPENGEPVLNRGFQNWNFLVMNMIAWLDGRPLAEEF